MRIIAFVIAALVTLVGRIGAQSVPDFSFGLAAGSGAHTLHARSVYYISERAAMFRASGTFALARHGLVRPILTIDATASCLGFLCAEDDTCPIAPDGGCEVHFRAPGGIGLGVGVETVWSKYVIGSISAGVGSPFGRRIAFVGANLGLHLSSHIAWMADLRRYRFDNAHGERVWFAPISMGLRFY